MWNSRTLALVAVAAALTMGAGCVTRSTYQHDLAAEQAKTATAQVKAAALQEKLDQANKDVTKAQDTVAQKADDYIANQKAADNARGQVANLKQQVERLQASEKNSKEAADKAGKEQAEKLKALQDQVDAAQKENASLREAAEKLKAQIGELKAQVEGKSPAPAPTTSAPVPAGT